MTSQPANDTPTIPDELDPTSMAAIRDLMASVPEAPADPDPQPEHHVSDAVVETVIEPATAPKPEDLAPELDALADKHKEPAPEPAVLAPEPEILAEEPEVLASKPEATADMPDTVPLAVAAVVAEQADQPAPAKRRNRKVKAAKSKAIKPPKQPRAKTQLQRKLEGMIAAQKAKVLAYRPTVKHVLLACFALLLVFRPFVLAGLFFLFALILTAVFLILGYDGFWRRFMGLMRWHAQRHPSRSADLHRKLDSFAVKFDGFLDRFPEGTVDDLYLPDFGDQAEADARHDAVLTRRFETLREREA